MEKIDAIPDIARCIDPRMSGLEQFSPGIIIRLACERGIAVREFTCGRVIPAALLWVGFRRRRSLQMSIQSFAMAVNIRRFQNLLETSVDETMRQTLQRLLVEEKAKSEIKESEPDRQ